MANMPSKPAEDGFISILINRRFSNRISRHIVNSPVTPNAITVLSFLICVAGAFLFSLGQYLSAMLAGLCIQFASIIDGCDGEIARMRSEGTAFGACLDTILDRYADAAIVVGITYAYWARHPNPIVWVVGFLALMGFILASYAKKEYRIRYNDRRPAGTFDRLTKRDLRLFGLMVGALCNRPYEALVMLGILSHIWVGWSLVDAYTQRAKRPDQSGVQLSKLSTEYSPPDL